jgi:hypothetical protein
LAQDKTAFIARFRDKIMQLESYRQSLLDLIFQDPDQSAQVLPKISPAIHIKAIDSLHKITLSLIALEKMLPLVTRFSKDMDIDELLKLNKVYTDGLASATNQAFEPQGNVNLEPQYVRIERMINDILKKSQDGKSSDSATDITNIETNSDANYTNRFRAIL